MPPVDTLGAPPALPVTSTSIGRSRLSSPEASPLPGPTLLKATERLLICAPELARLLGVSQRQVAAHAASGRLPRPVRLGRATRWRVEEIREWLAAGAPAREKWELLRQRTMRTT